MHDTELEGLIFDVDGTLADTERSGHRVAYNAAFRELGLDWNWDPEFYGILLAVHGGKERLHHYVDHYAPEIGGVRNVDAFIDDIHALKTEKFVDIVRRQGMPARPGIKRLIKEAYSTGLRLAIATTTSRANVEALLATAIDPDASAWFEEIAAGEDAVHKKPSSEIYDFVRQRMGIPAQRLIALEDSRNGMLSASGSGVRTVITVNEYTAHEDFSEAILVVDQLGEPDRAMRVLSSRIPVNDYSFVDVACLRFLLGRICAPV